MNELTHNEIQKLKSQVAKLQLEKASRLENSLLSPALYDHYQKVAKMLSQSGVIPKSYQGKPADVFVAMAMGYQLGFAVEQSLQDIAVINGRPCLWGDGLLSLCLNHPDCIAINETPTKDNGHTTGYTCTVHRKNHGMHSQTFTLQDAEQAGLLRKGGVWNSYPARMLQMRARSLALRDKFADALRGLRIAEIEKDTEPEIKDMGKLEAINVTAQTTTQTDKIKRLIKPDVAKDKKKSDESEEELVVATDNQLTEIERLMENLQFTEERRANALDSIKVKSLEEVSVVGAAILLDNLHKIEKQEMKR